MQRVMDYMKERELRPTELFRSFDKAVKSKLSRNQFAKRIQVLYQGKIHYSHTSAIFSFGV